jgi:phospholipid/cholesterol/gamma-HCH transport system ATP-binding protein
MINNIPTNIPSVVEIEKVTFLRGERLILDQVNVVIPKGKITAIMGPSGCGKTTLLRLIGGQILVDYGTVRVFGLDLAKISRKELYRLRRQMGMLFQSGALFTDLTVFENVAFPLRVHTNLSEDMIRDLVLIKLEAVGLRGAHSLMPSSLSGGMVRRVALARAIILDPNIIMYDEPFTGQDPISMGVLVNLIKHLNNLLGLTTILVSHDIRETLSIADFVYLISNGSIVASGTPKQLQSSSNPWVQQFILGLPDGPVPFHYPANDYKEDLFLC